MLEHAVGKKALFRTAHHAVVVAVVDKALPQAKRRGGQAEYFELRVLAAQVLDHLPIAGVLLQRYPMALVDYQQSKAGVVELLQVTHHRLHRAKHHLAASLFAL